VIGEVSDGLEAIRKAQELHPDLILLDIGLPGLNGIEAARRIRRFSPKSKILFVSQESSADVVQLAFSLGACGYVVKMDARGELLSAVDAALRGEQFVGSRFAGHDFIGASDIEPSDAGNPEKFRSKTVFDPLLQEKGSTRRHEARLYSDDERLLDDVTQFIGAAIKAGNAAIAVATESHRNGILPKLHAYDVDVAAVIEQGRYTTVDAADVLSTFIVNGTLDPVLFLECFSKLILKAANAAKGEHPRVAVFGEGADLLWKHGNVEAAIQDEKLCNELTKRYDVDILCGYSMGNVQGGMDTHSFQRICAEHSAVHSS
jgi:CheY-like chemotaxis protein